MKNWPQKQFSAFASIKHGYAFESKFFCTAGDYVLLTPGNFREEGGFRQLQEKQKYYSGDIPRNSILKKDDLLIAMTEQSPGLLGSTILIPEGDKFLHNQRLGLVLIEDRQVSKFYLYHVFNSPIVRKPISETSAGTKVKHTSPDKIGKLKIPVPSLDQQIAIADLLSTWDQAIEKTERLIAAKERGFRGLIDDLIGGAKKRKYWKAVRLGEIFTERVETGRSDLPLLSITRDEGVINRDEVNRKDTSNEDKSKYLRICPGDIGYNTMRMWQGVSALSTLEGIVSPAYTICIPSKEIHGRFIAHYFKTPRMINWFYRYSQGLTSDTWNLKFHHFAEIRTAIPPLEMQKQIADVLDIAQQEISILKKQSESYRQQKRGLMQKLLTGAWRVKVKDSLT